MLEQILAIAVKMKKPVKIYDLSKLPHRLRAAERWIFRTPVVIVDKVRYKSLDDCLPLISGDSNP